MWVRFDPTLARIWSEIEDSNRDPSSSAELAGPGIRSCMRALRKVTLWGTMGVRVNSSLFLFWWGLGVGPEIADFVQLPDPTRPRGRPGKGPGRGPLDWSRCSAR